MLYRALFNISVNGLQAMEDGGKLQVKTRNQDGDQVLISIKDTGCGMDELKTKKIFEPFFTDKNKGTGLGLAITRNCIAGHHGEIAVTSSPGAGTEFTIFLPKP
jgi:signal transduction histidine kinase